MCIAILNPSNVILEKETLKNCWENNGDGAGLLWVDNGKLKSYKAMVDFEKLYNKYLEIRKSRYTKESQVVIHFRISTHGKVNRTNCHPFIVNEKLGFVHNGIISKVERNDNFSDTYMFNEIFLKELPKDFYKSGIYHDLIESYIGGSKLLFLDTNNDAYIINESMGVWDMGCWFSNTTYKYSKYVDMGGVKVLKSTYDKSKGIGYSNSNYPSNYGYGSYNNGYGRGYDASYDYGRKLDSNNAQTTIFPTPSISQINEDLKVDAEKKNKKWWEDNECDFCGTLDDTTKKYQKYDNAKLCNTCNDEIEGKTTTTSSSVWDNKDGDVF
jgi:predicted glutamine amidotransferase